MDLFPSPSHGTICVAKFVRHDALCPPKTCPSPRILVRFHYQAAGFKTALVYCMGPAKIPNSYHSLFCFRVPELTRRGDIQLNKRVSLRRRPERIHSHQPDNFPASGPSMAKPSGVILRLAALF
jgi:hypothetical protein